jgi:hypothetical protein
MDPQHLSTLASLPTPPLQSIKPIAGVTVGSALKLAPQQYCANPGSNLYTTSSTEAELVACADAIPYVEGVRKLLTELNFPIGPPSSIKTTNPQFA